MEKDDLKNAIDEILKSTEEWANEQARYAAEMCEKLIDQKIKEHELKCHIGKAHETITS